MFIRNVSIALFSYFVCAAVAAASGGAWTRDEDGYYVKIGLSSMTSQRQFGYDGRLTWILADTFNLRDTEFGVTDVALYGELGLAEWLTGVASTQYKVAVRKALYRPTGRDSTASASGLGDLWLGARLRLLPRGGPNAAALTLSVKLPTGSPLQAIPLGTGVVDYEAAIAGGTSFPVFERMRGYAQLSGAYRLRNGTVANEMNYAAEVGLNLNETFMLQASVDGVHSFADFDAAAQFDDNPETIAYYLFDQSFMRWGLGVIYTMNPGLELNANYNWNSSGRNSLLLSGLSVGIAWKK